MRTKPTVSNTVCTIAHRPLATHMPRYRLTCFQGDFEVDEFDWATADTDSNYVFRPKYCGNCPNPLKGTTGVSIFSAMSFDEILTPRHRTNFFRHIPAMIIRASARWRMHQALEEQKLYDRDTLDDLEDHIDIRTEIIRMWLRSAEPYLEQHPL